MVQEFATRRNFKTPGLGLNRRLRLYPTAPLRYIGSTAVLLEPGGALLETEATLEVRHIIADLKPGDGDLLTALHRVQERFGFIPPMSIPVVARQLRLTPARVFGAITFYSEFRTTPPPETLVSWCSGPACLVRGSLNVRAAMEAVLGVGMGESTPDNSVGFHLGQCNGACDLAPLVWLNGRARGPLSVADAVRLARELKEGQGSGVKGQRKLS